MSSEHTVAPRERGVASTPGHAASDGPRSGTPPEPSDLSPFGLAHPDRPHATGLGVSPSRGEIPLWVSACVLFDPPEVNAADKVNTAVGFLMASTVRVHGDLAVRLSPMRLALLCGFERPEKAKWLTDYLQKIKFLKIVDGGVNPKTGRRQARRDAKGRPIDNEFVVFPEPPAEYFGPRTLAEIDALIAEDIAEAELAHERKSTPGAKRGKPRNIPIRTRQLFREPGPQSTLPGGGMDFRTQPLPRGDGYRGARLSAGQPTLLPRGADSRPHPPLGGDGQVFAGGSIPSEGSAYRVDRSSISEGVIEDRVEPVPDGTALPPATGMDERQVGAVREAVRSFPINAWYAKRGQVRAMSRQDADLLQSAVCDAMQRYGLTLEQVREIGQAAVSDARKTPVTYVAAAFGAKLPIWLARVSPEPGAANPLPLLDGAIEAPKAVKNSANIAASTDATCQPEPGVMTGPCPGCGAEPGQPRMYRMVEVDAGWMAPCKVCCPPTAAP